MKTVSKLLKCKRVLDTYLACKTAKIILIEFSKLGDGYVNPDLLLEIHNIIRIIDENGEDALLEIYNITGIIDENGKDVVSSQPKHAKVVYQCTGESNEEAFKRLVADDGVLQNMYRETCIAGFLTMVEVFTGKKILTMDEAEQHLAVSPPTQTGDISFILNVNGYGLHIPAHVFNTKKPISLSAMPSYIEFYGNALKLFQTMAYTLIK